MYTAYRRKIGARATLALLFIIILLFLLSSAVSAQMPGDVNFDGIVDIRDVVMVQRYSLGYQPPLTAMQVSVADVNGDGVVNVIDTNLIMQYIQGYINSFPTFRPHAPVLITPAEGASVGGSMVSFQWGAVTGAIRYQLEISKVSDGTIFRIVDLGNVTAAAEHAFGNDGAQYRWRVRAGSSTQWGAWSLHRSFTNGAALPAPTLLSPANNSALTGTSVLFRWNEVNSATKYQLEVLKGSDNVPFKDVVVGNIAMSEQFGFVRDGTQYRWRVRAGNNTGWGAWSGYFILTGGSTPAAPTLASPANDVNVPGFQISFQWNAVSGANKYELEVVDKSNSAFVVKTILDDVTSSLQRGFTSDASSYKWRVRAGSTEGWGPWSDYRHFINGNAPAGPVLTYPLNNEIVSGDRVTFEWNPAPGADRYELLIQYDTAAGTEYRRIMVGYVHASRQTDFPNDGSNFRWSVRSGNANGWGEFTTPSRKFTNGLPFSAPVLQTPAAYSTQGGTSVTFTWDTVLTAARYNLEVVDARTGVTKNSEFPTANSLALTGFPNDGSEYKWRVRAGDSSRWGAWSPYRYFINETIAAGAPSAPSLLSPAINATAATPTVEFKWTTSSGALNYQLQVVRVSGGAVVVDVNFGAIVTSSAQSGFPVDGSEFLWRVRAGNAANWGPWSFYRGFTNGSWWVFPF